MARVSIKAKRRDGKARVQKNAKAKAARSKEKPLTVPQPVQTLQTNLRTEGPPPQQVALEIPVQEEPTLEYLRFTAGLAYTTDLHGVTLEQLSEREPFKGRVGMPLLERWSAKDQWVARRETLIGEWRKSIEQKMGQRVVSQALADLATTDDLVADALDKIRNRVGKVNSYEGLVNATVRLMEFRQQLRGQVLGATTPIPGAPGAAVATQGAPLAQMPKPVLSVEDARAAAQAIMRRRREEMRAELAEGAATEAAQDVVIAETVKREIEEAQPGDPPPTEAKPA